MPWRSGAADRRNRAQQGAGLGRVRGDGRQGIRRGRGGQAVIEDQVLNDVAFDRWEWRAQINTQVVSKPERYAQGVSYRSLQSLHSVASVLGTVFPLALRAAALAEGKNGDLQPRARIPTPKTTELARDWYHLPCHRSRRFAPHASCAGQQADRGSSPCVAVSTRIICKCLNQLVAEEGLEPPTPGL